MKNFLFLRFLIIFRGSWVGAAMKRPLSLKKLLVGAAHPLKLLGGRRQPAPTLHLCPDSRYSRNFWYLNYGQSFLVFKKITKNFLVSLVFKKNAKNFRNFN